MLHLWISSLIWAFSYGLIKTNLSRLSPDFVAFVRMLLPFTLFLPFYRKKLIPLKTQLFFFLIGAVQYGLMYTLCIRAYQYLPAHLVVLFTACTPVYVTLFNDLFRKSFSPLFFLASLIALGSVFFLQSQIFFANISFKGFCLVQLSDICFALGIIAYKYTKSSIQKVKDQNLYALLFGGGTFATICSTSLFEGWSSWNLLTSYQTLLLIYLGLIPSGICFFLWNRASAFVNAGTLAVANNLKVPLGVFVSIVLFGEEANLFYLFISSFLILSSLIITEMRSKYFTPKQNRN